MVSLLHHSITPPLQTRSTPLVPLVSKHFKAPQTKTFISRTPRTPGTHWHPISPGYHQNITRTSPDYHWVITNCHQLSVDITIYHQNIMSGVPRLVIAGYRPQPTPSAFFACVYV